MIWLILVIILVGWAIVSAINRSNETNARIAVYNSMSDEEKAEYNRQQVSIQQQAQTQAMLRKRAELLIHIYQLRREGKSGNRIAANNKVQSLAAQAGVAISSGEDIKTITLTRDFLEATKLIVPFQNMINDGADDHTIAKKLGSGWNPDTSKYTWYKLYKPEDIATLREALEPTKSSVKTSSWADFNKAIDQN